MLLPDEELVCYLVEMLRLYSIVDMRARLDNRKTVCHENSEDYTFVLTRHLRLKGKTDTLMRCRAEYVINIHAREQCLG